MDAECDIAKGMQQGDSQAWSAFYEAYAERVWINVARLLGFDSEAIADVVQETFLKAACSAKNYKPRCGSLWTWLWKIARDEIALHYRRQSRRSRISLAGAQSWWSSLNGEKNNWPVSKADTPPDVLVSRELAVLVRHCIAGLTPEYQALLISKYVDGQTVEEIAKGINCSPVAAQSRLARARKAFRKSYMRLTNPS
ncbi:MAG: RNA polymerase sigma factor [Planctomycetota bacterium]|jgi:RNA polymerase sigma-70 factor (ECF subfamily)